jgi:hypothetical protein
VEHIQPGPPPDPKDPRIQPQPLGYPEPGAAPHPLPPALPAVSFPSVPYAPDGGFPVGGFFAVLMLTIVAGVAVGILAGLLHQVFYLVLFFPILMGGAVGLAGWGAIVLGKVRSRPFALCAGLLGGLLTIVAMHFVSYLIFVSRTRVPISFPRFVDAVAQAGVTFNRASGGRDKGMNLGHVGSYIYWGVEMLIVAGFAGGIMWARAGKPFCRDCGSWKTEHKLGVLFLSRGAAEDYFQAGELSRLADPNEPPGEGPIALSIWWCPYCLEAAPVEAALVQTVPQKKGAKVVNLGTRTFPGESLPVFRSLCQHRADPNVPPALR